MNLWYLIDLFAFLGGAVATLLITPFFQWIAVKTDFLDRPQANHKGHCRPTPLLGGAAMFTGWILCIGGGISHEGDTLMVPLKEIVKREVYSRNSARMIKINPMDGRIKLVGPKSKRQTRGQQMPTMAGIWFLVLFH